MSTAMSSGVEHIIWREYRRLGMWNTTDAGVWGNHHAVYPRVVGDRFYSEVLYVPAGQGTSVRTVESTTVLSGIEGSVVVEIGDSRFKLNAFDMLVLPRASRYRALNEQFDGALVLSVVGESDGAKDVDEDLDMPTLIDWASSQRLFHRNLPLADVWGFHRSPGPVTRSNVLRGHMNRMPAGQTSPWHGVPRGLLFLQLAGELELACGGGTWPLSPRDMLYIPPNVPYSYSNFGMSESVFLDIGAPPLRAGLSTVYYESDPGWPVRDDAVVMFTRSNGVTTKIERAKTRG